MSKEEQIGKEIHDLGREYMGLFGPELVVLSEDLLQKYRLMYGLAVKGLSNIYVSEQPYDPLCCIGIYGKYSLRKKIEGVEAI